MTEQTWDDAQVDWLMAFSYSAGVAFTEHHYGTSLLVALVIWLALGIAVGLGMSLVRVIKRAARRKAGIA